MLAVAILDSETASQWIARCSREIDPGTQIRIEWNKRYLTIEKPTSSTIRYVLNSMTLSLIPFRNELENICCDEFRKATLTPKLATVEPPSVPTTRFREKPLDSSLLHGPDNLPFLLHLAATATIKGTCSAAAHDGIDGFAREYRNLTGEDIPPKYFRINPTSTWGVNLMVHYPLNDSLYVDSKFDTKITKRKGVATHLGYFSGKQLIMAMFKLGFRLGEKHQFLGE